MRNLKPILLEVNANPSMKIEYEKEVSPGVTQCVPSPVDEEVKVAVIRDTLRLVDPYKKDENEDLLEEGFVEKLELGGSETPESSIPTFSLKQVFPKYAKQFDYLRLVDRIATLFIRFLGVKGTTKLGPTSFRTFIRNCKINNSGFSMAAVDILYIDITRRGSGLEQRDAGEPGPARSAGGAGRGRGGGVCSAPLCVGAAGPGIGHARGPLDHGTRQVLVAAGMTCCPALTRVRVLTPLQD
uniref:Uncharacterized protein n=1 Tax=Varanus komodoensis TaxID=61221 RepID=A0A8D2Q981_VARKO